MAATDLIAPVSATKLAMGGLGAFLGWTEDFRTEGLITAPLLGVLITMTDPRTRITREVVEALQESDLPLFETTIPRRVAAEDQVADRLVVGDPAANARSHRRLQRTRQRGPRSNASEPTMGKTLTAAQMLSAGRKRPPTPSRNGN